MLKRLLASELKNVAKRNLIAERKFSEMLERAMRAYTNRSLDAAEIITELVELAKEMRKERDRGTALGLRDDELAFYDAVCQNDSAVLELGDDTLKAIAHDLVAIVRRNATIDWDKKEQVRASLRRHIRRLLAKYKYPPDKQESAVAARHAASRAVRCRARGMRAIVPKTAPLGAAMAADGAGGRRRRRRRSMCGHRRGKRGPSFGVGRYQRTPLLVSRP